MNRVSTPPPLHSKPSFRSLLRRGRSIVGLTSGPDPNVTSTRRRSLRRFFDRGVYISSPENHMPDPLYKIGESCELTYQEELLPQTTSFLSVLDSRPTSTFDLPPLSFEEEVSNAVQSTPKRVTGETIRFTPPSFVGDSEASPNVHGSLRPQHSRAPPNTPESQGSISVAQSKSISLVRRAVSISKHPMSTLIPAAPESSLSSLLADLPQEKFAPSSWIYPSNLGNHDDRSSILERDNIVHPTTMERRHSLSPPHTLDSTKSSTKVHSKHIPITASFLDIDDTRVNVWQEVNNRLTSKFNPDHAIPTSDNTSPNANSVISLSFEAIGAPLSPSQEGSPTSALNTSLKYMPVMWGTPNSTDCGYDADFERSESFIESERNAARRLWARYLARSSMRSDDEVSSVPIMKCTSFPAERNDHMSRFDLCEDHKYSCS